MKACIGPQPRSCGKGDGEPEVRPAPPRASQRPAPMAWCDVVEHRATLERWLRAGTTAQRVVLRSRIVLLAADGLPSKYIAQRLGTSQDTVRVWRRRFAAGGPAVLTHDAPGRGRKRQITAAREQQVVDATLHTEPPRATHWSLRTMAAAQGLSPASIHRIWHADQTTSEGQAGLSRISRGSAND